MNFFIRDSNELIAGRTNSRCYGFEMVYRQGLSQACRMIGSLSSVRTEEDDVSDRRANTIFIELEKRVGWN